MASVYWRSLKVLPRIPSDVNIQDIQGEGVSEKTLMSYLDTQTDLADLSISELHDEPQDAQQLVRRPRARTPSKHFSSFSSAPVKLLELSASDIDSNLDSWKEHVTSAIITDEHGIAYESISPPPMKRTCCLRTHSTLESQ